MNVIFLGPPGAGKGTQGVVLSRELKMPHISTGDLLREAVKIGSPLGVQAKSFMDKGDLVPDAVVIGIVIDNFKKIGTQHGFILDGFPRTLKQALDLDAALGAIKSPVSKVVYFETSPAVAVSRLTGRRVCKSCGRNFHVKNIPPKVAGVCDYCGGELYQRPDDNEATVMNRLKVYEDQTKPLIDYYTKQGKLTKVSGDLDVPELFKVLSKVVSAGR